MPDATNTVLNEKKLNQMKVEILRLEQNNLKTREKPDGAMVDAIKKIIVDESKSHTKEEYVCYSNRCVCTISDSTRVINTLPSRVIARRMLQLSLAITPSEKPHCFRLLTGAFIQRPCFLIQKRS